MTRHPIWLITLIGIIIISVAIGTLGLQADAMWHDEQLSLLYAGGLDDTPFNLGYAAEQIIERGSGQAPVYYVLLSAWGHSVGWSVMTMRTFSLLVGVLAIAFAYRVGADIQSPFAGFCAAVILSASAFFSAYLHEIRTYSLLVLEILVVLTLYWRLLHTQRRYGLMLAFVIVTTATLYTHPFAIVAIGALGLYHILLAPKHNQWWHIFFMLGLSAMLFAPWGKVTLDIIANRVENNTRTLTIRTNAEVIRDMLHAFSNGVWAFLLLLVPSIPLLRKSHGVRLLWFTGAVFAGVMLGANQLSDMINHVRYLMPLLPPVVLLMGIGLASLRQYRKLVYGLLAAWVAVGFISAPTFGNIFYTFEEHRVFHITFPFDGIISDIKSDAVTNDAVALEFPFHSWAIHGIIDYYMDGTPARYVLTDLLGAGDDDPQAKIAGFDYFIGDAGRVWFVVDHTVKASDFRDAYQAILDDRYVLCETLRDDDTARIDKLAQIEALCQEPDTPQFTYDQNVLLYDIVHQQTDTEDVIYTTWSAPVPADTYSISLQFIDSNGDTVYQVDKPLPLGDFAYQIDRIPQGTLPDDATLNIIVYAWQTGERLRLSDGTDAIQFNLNR